jgi:hypothetical protein
LAGVLIITVFMAFTMASPSALDNIIEKEAAAIIIRKDDFSVKKPLIQV